MGLLDITGKELEDTYTVLLSDGRIKPDDEHDIDRRWIAMAKTFAELLYHSFEVLVQMAYVYADSGHAIFVPVEPILARPDLRVWVFNDYNQAADWAESQFHDLGSTRQAGPSQSPAGGALSQRSSEHNDDEAGADYSSGGTSGREESINRDDATHTGHDPSSAIEISGTSDDTSSDEASLAP